MVYSFVSVMGSGSGQPPRVNVSIRNISPVAGGCMKPSCNYVYLHLRGTIMKCLVFTSMFGLLATGALVAQETPRFTFDIGAGFTQPVGTTGSYLNDGWNIQGGVGYNFSSYLGAMLQVDYNSLGVNS